MLRQLLQELRQIRLLLKDILEELRAIHHELSLRPYTITVGGNVWEPGDNSGAFISDPQHTYSDTVTSDE